LKYIIFSLKINQSKSWVEAIKEQSAAKYQEALSAKAVQKQSKPTFHQKLKKQLNSNGQFTMDNGQYADYQFIVNCPL
jgi:hypothetical protein